MGFSHNDPRRLTLAVVMVWLACANASNRFGFRRNSNTSRDKVVPVSTAGFAATAVAPAVDPPTEMVVQEAQGNTNFIVGAVWFVRDAFTRTMDGIGTSWSNYGKCNQIRGKQKQYRQALKQQWENEGLFSRSEINGMLKKHKFGGITYEEYAFLKQGLTDRNKLTQILLWSWAAPRFLPYMIMMNPDMLPSAFGRQAKLGEESQQHALSRSRSHAVLQTLIKLERDAHVIPTLAQFNIFGRKKQQRAMEEADRMGRRLSHFWVEQQQGGIEAVMDSLGGLIYTDTEPTKQQTNLVGLLPKSVYKGFQQVLDSGGAAPFTNLLPTFFARRKLLEHLQRITEGDEFLIDQKVDIQSLSSPRLHEACQERMVGGASDEELRQSLQEWLDATVVQPRQQASGYYNGNLARTALLAYHVMQATQSSASASYLPRTLYQAQVTSE